MDQISVNQINILKPLDLSQYMFSLNRLLFIHNHYLKTNHAPLRKHAFVFRVYPGNTTVNKAPVWGLKPNLNYCQTVTGLLTWGALSDERTGLSFTIAAGPRQCSHSRVRVPKLPQIRDFPFCRLLWLAGLRRKYWTPTPHRITPAIQLRVLL
jgi:hypothetical protein